MAPAPSQRLFTRAVFAVAVSRGQVVHMRSGANHRRAALYFGVCAPCLLAGLACLLPFHSIAGFLAIVVPYSVYMAYVESQHHEHEKKLYPHMKCVSLTWVHLQVGAVPPHPFTHARTHTHTRAPHSPCRIRAKRFPWDAKDCDMFDLKCKAEARE